MHWADYTAQRLKERGGDQVSASGITPSGEFHIGHLREILSAEMMLRHINWNEAADLLIDSIEKTIQDKFVTYDFERLMDDATLVSCSGFAKEMIKRM